MQVGGEFYNELLHIWDELAGYFIVPTCTCAAAAALSQEKENEKVHDFLVGLGYALYGTVVSNNLMIDPLPNLNTITTLSRAHRNCWLRSTRGC